MYLQLDPLYNPPRTRPIQTGREMLMEPYPNQQVGSIDNLDGQSGTGSVLTRTRTRSDSPEPLLTLLNKRVTIVFTYKNHQYIHFGRM